jgi:predicted nucleotidyltransferase
MSVPVPESQLSTWSNQGATGSAAATYESIRRALTAATAPRAVRGAEIYLQGSYKNDTNVRGDSDVDIVVQLNDTTYSNSTRLSADDRARYEAGFTRADYQWADFRRDVLTGREHRRPRRVARGLSLVSRVGVRRTLDGGLLIRGSEGSNPPGRKKLAANQAISEQMHRRCCSPSRALRISYPTFWLLRPLDRS